MDIILDTCALLSLLGLVKKRISKKTLAEISSAEEVFVSSCSIFELAIKHKKEKIDLKPFTSARQLWVTAFDEYELTELTVNHNDFYNAAYLPDFHADPFDRIIIAQALGQEARIVTFDSRFSDYSVRVLS